MKQLLNEVERMQKIAGIKEGALMDTYEFRITGTIKVGPGYGAATSYEAMEIVKNQLENLDIRDLDITEI